MIKKLLDGIAFDGASLWNSIISFAKNVAIFYFNTSGSFHSDNCKNEILVSVKVGLMVFIAVLVQQKNV